MARPRLHGLQALRGLAAVMVLVGHVIAEAEHYFGLPLPGDFFPWTRGVDIFFVISGFVVTLSAERFLNRPGAFLGRRLLRVAPLYFLFTTLMVLVLLTIPGGSKDTSLDPFQIISSYTFFPYERLDGRIAPVLSLGWTLNYEVFFYSLFALCLALPRPLLAVSALLAGLGFIGVLVEFDSPQLTFWTNPIIMEFVFGILLARMWMRRWRRPGVRLGVAIGLLGLALLAFLAGTGLPRVIAAGVPAAIIVAAGTVFWPNRPIWNLGLGDASYALYLSHRFALRAATLLLLPLLPATPLAAGAYVVVVCLLALAFARLTHSYIEKPLMRALQAPPKELTA